MKVDLGKITEENILSMPQKSFVALFGNLEKAYNLCRSIYNNEDYIPYLYSEDIIKEWFDTNYPNYILRNRSRNKCVAPRQCLFYLLSKHTSLHDDSILNFTKLEMERTVVVHSRKIVLKMIASKEPVYCGILENFEKTIGIIKKQTNEKRID